MKWQLHPLSALPDHLQAWDSVNEAMGNLPFLRSTFISLLLDVFGSGKERLAICIADGDVAALGIVAPRGNGVWETFQPSQLPLGAWVMRPDCAWEPLLSGLVRALPGIALRIGVTQQDPRLLPRPEAASGVPTLDYVETAWIDVAGSFDAYWEARGKNLRQNMRKQRNKLAEEKIAAHLDVLREASQVADAIRDYGALESAGWKAGSGTAIAVDNAQGRFYGAMLEAFCKHGASRIYRYRVDDKVVAVDLCIESGDTLAILKTTYDESYKSLSPASLLHQDAFRHVFEEGRIRRIEFYGKVMEWHKRWTENVRMLYHANYDRWAWVPKLQRLAAGIATRATTT
jgi:hypothetical protein